MAIRRIEGTDDDVIVMDDTYFPVVVATWFGAPSEKAVRIYFEWAREMVARATREGARIVNITDAGPAKTPDAAVRRLIADLTKALEAAGGNDEAMMSYVVVENAVIRGVMTALGWLHGNLKAHHVSTCAEALEAGIRELARARMPLPKGLEPAKWRRPERLPRGT